MPLLPLDDQSQNELEHDVDKCDSENHDPNKSLEHRILNHPVLAVGLPIWELVFPSFIDAVLVDVVLTEALHEALRSFL